MFQVLENIYEINTILLFDWQVIASYNSFISVDDIAEQIEKLVREAEDVVDVKVDKANDSDEKIPSHDEMWYYISLFSQTKMCANFILNSICIASPHKGNDDVTLFINNAFHRIIIFNFSKIPNI